VVYQLSVAQHYDLERNERACRDAHEAKAAQELIRVSPPALIVRLSL
jgi:hypothetical protein